jgi:UDP-glucose 4-epimerase
MKIAIFGASGFVGRNIIEIFDKNGIDYIASDIQDNPIFAMNQYQKADILKYDEVCRVLEGCDAVVHLAAHPLPASLKNPLLNARVNIEGTLNILEAMRNSDVKKIIFSSASSIVGEVKKSPVDEEYKCQPKTPYAVSKYSIEHYLRVYHEIFDIDYLIFRFFNVYGPWQYPKSGALIPNVYKKLISQEPFTIFGDGRQTRDYIFVQDIAQFYVYALKRNISNELINMGTGEGTTVKDILKISGEILGTSPKIINSPPRLGEIDNFVADITKLKKIFRQTPQTQLRTGLEQTFTWLRLSGETA